MKGVISIILVIYFICHLPAFILVLVGLSKRKKKPELSMKLFIAAAVYFLIGGGICGMLLFR